MRVSKARTLLAVFGIVLVAAAVALLTVPELYQVVGVSDEVLMIAAWVMTAVLLFYALRAFSIDTPEAEELYLRPDNPPETVEDPEGDLKLEMKDNDERFRETVKDVLKEIYGKSEEEAENLIESGEWTENGVAAAYVDKSVSYPVLERLREWIEDSGTEERRRSETVEAIENLYSKGDRDE